MLLELFSHQRQRKLRAVDRDVQIAENVRNRADVVFMRVRENDGADHALVLFQVGNVGNDDVDAE